MKRLGDNQNHHNRFLTAIIGWWRQADVGTDLNRIFVLIVLALGTGFIFNTAFMSPKQSDSLPAQPGPTAPEITPGPRGREITMKRAYQLTQGQQAVIVDTRHPVSYTREHIAGAVNLPVGELDSYYPDFASQVDKNQTVILYCEAGCSSRNTIAYELRQHGYQDLNVMAEGPKEWAAAGYPLATEGDTHPAEGERH